MCFTAAGWVFNYSVQLPTHGLISAGTQSGGQQKTRRPEVKLPVGGRNSCWLWIWPPNKTFKFSCLNIENLYDDNCQNYSLAKANIVKPIFFTSFFDHEHRENLLIFWFLTLGKFQGVMVSISSRYPLSSNYRAKYWRPTRNKIFSPERKIV